MISTRRTDTARDVSAPVPTMQDCRSTAIPTPAREGRAHQHRRTPRQDPATEVTGAQQATSRRRSGCCLHRRENARASGVTVGSVIATIISVQPRRTARIRGAPGFRVREMDGVAMRRTPAAAARSTPVRSC